MAQLKDLLVTGASRLIGDVFTNKIQVKSVSAPTTSNGSTYSTGTEGHLLVTNGTSVFWTDLTEDMANVEAMLVSFGLQANAGLEEGIVGTAELDYGTVHAEGGS